MPQSIQQILLFLVLIIFLAGNTSAQNGYIYVHIKSLSQELNQSFNFTVSGGSTVVSPFTLEDQPNNIEPTDIGGGHGTGGGELWAVTGATGGANGAVYHRAPKSATWAAVAGQTASAIDGADLGHCVIVNTSGDAYVYNGATFFKIFNHSTIGSNAVDIANNGSINAGQGVTAVVDNNGKVWKYTGNYTVTTTWSNITPTDQSGGTFKRLDIDPTTNDIILIDGSAYVTKVNSSGGSRVYYGRGGGSTWLTMDVAVDNGGNVYAIQNNTVGGDMVYRYNGSAWAAEPEMQEHYMLTCGDAGQAWCAKGYPASQYSWMSNESAIFTRTDDGTATWMDDERVVTTQNGNSILIPVAAGTYTVTEGNVATWNLQSITIYDSTSGSTTNVAGNSATLVVGAGQVVNALYINGLVSPTTVPGTCSVTNIIQNFGAGASAGIDGPPLAGLTDYHYFDSAALMPNDGYYSVSQGSAVWTNNALKDHTGLTNGYFMVVNASYAADEMYRHRVTGLAPGATYSLTFWAANLSTTSPQQPNILAGITDTASGAILGSVSTGYLPTDNAWHQYNFTFKASTTTGDLFLRNNAAGGQGNDLALDDIGVNQTCSVVLAVNMTNFNAVKQGSYVLLSWGAAYNPDLDYFEVERSTDNGVSWHMIGMVMGADSSSLQQECLFKDTKPLTGTNLYRIVTQSKTVGVTYSAVKQIEMQGAGETMVLLYPNPVGPENKLNVQLSGLDAGAYKIRLVAASGQEFKEFTYNINYSGSGLLVIPTNGMAPGTYVVMVSGNNKQLSRPIVIENK